MRIKLQHDRVLVLLDEQKAQSEGKHGASIRLAAEAQDYPTTGTVLAVGPGIATARGFKTTTLQKGQRVLLTCRPGQDLTINGAQHTLTREFAPNITPFEGILAVLE